MECNQRCVQVRITESGRDMYKWMDGECSQMMSNLLDLIPGERQPLIVEAMDEFSKLLDPNNQAFQEVLMKCCGQHRCCDQKDMKGDKE